MLRKFPFLSRFFSKLLYGLLSAAIASVVGAMLFSNYARPSVVKLNGDDPPHWDRSRARLAVGGGFRSCSFDCRSGSQSHHGLRFPKPPIIPDGQISRVRFETSAFLPRAFPKLGEV